jgi:hypothetical protein
MVLAAVNISVVIIAGAHAYKALKTLYTTDHEDLLAAVAISVVIIACAHAYKALKIL